MSLFVRLRRCLLSNLRRARSPFKAYFLIFIISRATPQPEDMPFHTPGAQYYRSRHLRLWYFAGSPGKVQAITDFPVPKP